MGSRIEFTRPDTQEAPAYLADPESGSARPGVVVIQEWWGLNDQIMGIADRFAGADYRALVPDLYRRRTTRDADEASHFMGNLDWADATHQDVQGAVHHLLATGSPRVAVLGFCMGGALAIAAAVHVKAMDAAVCFYGIPPRDFADPSRTRVPLQLHFAERDDWCNSVAQDQLRADLDLGNVDFVFHSYPGTQHAFMNEARPEVYDAQAAERAWLRTLTFLHEHIG